jgi:uncharacterized protein (DUF927 family)
MRICVSSATEAMREYHDRPFRVRCGWGKEGSIFADGYRNVMEDSRKEAV